MADDGHTLRNVDWRSVLPFTQVFRSFRIATHLSKLMLALILLLALYFGGRFMDAVWLKWLPQHAAHNGDLMVYLPGASYDEPQGVFITFFCHEVEQVNRVAAAMVNLDILKIEAPLTNFFYLGPYWLFTRHAAYGALFSAWFLVIWSIFGGAISRIAAVHVARDEKIAVRQALRFSVGKVLSFIFAPLIPLMLFFGLAAVLAVPGWVLIALGPIGKSIGPPVVGFFFFLALIIGFLLTLLLIGTLVGFGLMYPTIAVEGSDSFDAFSRAFSYIYARPWRMVLYMLMSLLYGAVTYLFVRFFVWLMLTLTHYFIAWFMGQDATLRWNALWPAPVADRLPYYVKFSSLNAMQRAGAGMISFWVYLAIAMVGAYVISFYFSSSTIVYYLMRREVDATEMDDVYLEEFEEEFSETPPAPTPPAPAASSDVAPAPPTV